MECVFEGCRRPAVARRLCVGHWKQQKLGKTLTAIKYHRPRNSRPQIICDEAPCSNPNLPGMCHVFRGDKNWQGYGRVNIRRKMIPVHRYCWEQENGPVEAGKEIDHQCRNRACCNVDHLRMVTHQINMVENSDSVAARNAAKTHCKHGHAFDEENTVYVRYGRACRKCINIWARKAKAKKRQKKRQKAAL